jgi:IS5 family transposase
MPSHNKGKEMDFDQMALRDAYQIVRGLGDKLPFLKGSINWGAFIPIVKSVFNDDDKVGGRPHTDEVVIVRAMVLQGLYGLSDQELEFQCNDRLSFRNFLGYPEKVPDFTTIWKIRERLQLAGKDHLIWQELQRQLNKMGYSVRKGVIQDATFVEADQGKKRIQEEKRAEKEDRKIEYTDKQKAHMDKDGSFAVKGSNVHFGYKTHVKSDIDNGLIRSIEVTTAKVHDSQVNLVRKGDKAAYRDKAYVGSVLPAGVKDMTMLRAVRGRKLNGGQQKRNRAISRVRSPGERPFSVIKRVFHGGTTFVKTIGRVRIKEVFKGIAYNVYTVFSLKKRTLAIAIPVS